MYVEIRSNNDNRRQQREDVLEEEEEEDGGVAEVGEEEDTCPLKIESVSFVVGDLICYSKLLLKKEPVAFSVVWRFRSGSYCVYQLQYL